MAKKDGDFFLKPGGGAVTRSELNTIFQHFHEYFLIDVDNEGIAADIISEKTSATGVTVDGVLLRDSAVKTNSVVEKTSGQGVIVDGTKLKDGGIILGFGGQAVSINVIEYTIEVALTEANIVGMNGSPVEVVAAVADSSLEFIAAVLIYDFDTAAYTNGGVVTIEYSGGAAISTDIAAANSFGASGDKVFSMAPLNASGGYTMPVNTALDITNATAAFVDPGTAAGVGRLHITYRVHTTGF